MFLIVYNMRCRHARSHSQVQIGSPARGYFPVISNPIIITLIARHTLAPLKWSSQCSCVRCESSSCSTHCMVGSNSTPKCTQERCDNNWRGENNPTTMLIISNFFAENTSCAICSSRWSCVRYSSSSCSTQCIAGSNCTPKRTQERCDGKTRKQSDDNADNQQLFC